MVMLRICIALLVCIPLAAGQAADSAPDAPDRVGVGAGQTELSLASAIERALEHNLDIEIEKTFIETSAQDRFGAGGYLDPRFRLAPRIEDRTTPTSSTLIGTDGKLEQTIGLLEGSWGQRLPWWGASLRVALENSRQTTTNPFDVLSPFNTALFSANVSLPLTRGRSIDPARAQLRITSRRVALSEVQFELQVIDVVSAVQESYWNLVAARQNVTVSAEAVALAREQLARTKRMIAAGTLASVELAAAEAELERRIDTWYAAIGLVTETENALKLLLGRGSEDPFWNNEILPSGERTLGAPEFGTVQEAVNLALGQRPELRQADLQLETNDIRARLARNQTRVAVNVVGGYSLAGLSGAETSRQNPFTDTFRDQLMRLNTLSGLHGLPPLPPGQTGGVAQAIVGPYSKVWSQVFQADFPTVYAGVQIDWTARNRAARAELAKTAIAERRIRLERQQFEQSIAAQVRNALQSIQTARQRIAAAEASVRAAQEKVDSEIRLFRNGESTNFLVLTRQNELSDSRRRAVVARLDFNKAIARAQQALGATLESNNITLD